MIEPAIPPGATVTRPDDWIEARRLMTQWIQNATKAVQGAFPLVDWRRDTDETRKAQSHLEWYLWSHFYSKTSTVSDVRDAWRKYYQLFLPGQAPLIETAVSPMGDRKD